VCLTEEPIDQEGIYEEGEEVDQISFRPQKATSARWMMGDELGPFMRDKKDGSLEIHSLEGNCIVKLLNDCETVEIEYLRLTKQTKVFIGVKLR